MIENLSDIARMSSFLNEWRGVNNRKVQTSNSKVADFFEKGKDCRVNVVLIKQLRKYDHDTYEKVLNEGVSILYQSMNIVLTNEINGINGKVYAKNGVQTGEVLIKNKRIKEVKPVSNIDANHVFRALIED